MNFYYDEEVEELKKLRKELEHYRPVEIDLADSIAVSPIAKIEKESYKYYMGQKNDLESIIKTNLKSFLTRAIKHRGYPLEVFTRKSFVNMLIKHIETDNISTKEFEYLGILYIIKVQNLEYFNLIIRPVLLKKFSDKIELLLSKVTTMTEEIALHLSIICSNDDEINKASLFHETLNVNSAIYSSQDYVNIIEILFDKIGDLFNNVYTYTCTAPGSVDIESELSKAVLAIVANMPMVYIRQVLMNYHEYYITNKKKPCISLKNTIYNSINEVLSNLYMEGIDIY